MKMKKKFIGISVLVLIITMTGCTKSTDQLNSDKKETKDNSIKEFLGDKYNFVCKDINNIEFHLTSNHIYMNNSIYDQGQLYSNDQNCKKINNINYDRYVILNSSAVGDIFIKNNQAYTFAQYENQDAKLVEYDWVSEYKEISLENGVISISLESSIWDDKDGATNYKFYVLKKDGNVYLYETKNHKVVKNDEIVYNSDEYGKIKYFYYASNSSKSIENIILLSDKGLYTNEIVKDDNCIKYAHVECKKEFKINKEYDKVKNEIVFFNKDYIVDKEYNLYNNNFIKLERIP